MQKRINKYNNYQERLQKSRDKLACYDEKASCKKHEKSEKTMQDMCTQVF